jgi:hypothetical protein
MEGITKFLDKLVPIGAPLDIIKSMYATPQPLELMKDIRDFSTRLEHINAIYSSRWSMSEEGHDVWDWLSNDLILYMNLDQATMYGYTNAFYQIWDKYLPAEIWGWNHRIAKRSDIFTPYMLPADAPKQLYRYTIPLSRRHIINNFMKCLGSLSSKGESRIYWAALDSSQRAEFIRQQLDLEEDSDEEDANEIQ